MYHCHIKLIELLNKGKYKCRNLLLEKLHHKLKMQQLLKRIQLKKDAQVDLVNKQRNLQEERNTIKNLQLLLMLSKSK